MATFTVSERSTLWLRAISIRTGYDTDVLQDKHDERQTSLSGRQNRHVEALFRLLHTTSPGRRHDVLGNHRNTSTIPASMLGAVTEAPTRFSAWYGTQH